MDQSRGGRHAKQGGHLRSAARLAVDHHRVGIPAEVRNILTNPPQRGHQIGHAHINGVFIAGASNFGDVEETENVKAMIHGDLNDIVVARHLCAFMRGQFVGGPE